MRKHITVAIIAGVVFAAISSAALSAPVGLRMFGTDIDMNDNNITEIGWLNPGGETMATNGILRFNEVPGDFMQVRGSGSSPHTLRYDDRTLRIYSGDATSDHTAMAFHKNPANVSVYNMLYSGGGFTLAPDELFDASRNDLNNIGKAYFDNTGAGDFINVSGGGFNTPHTLRFDGRNLRIFSGDGADTVMEFFNETGNVEIPNGDLALNSNNLTKIGWLNPGGQIIRSSSEIRFKNRGGDAIGFRNSASDFHTIRFDDQNLRFFSGDGPQTVMNMFHTQGNVSFPSGGLFVSDSSVIDGDLTLNGFSIRSSESADFNEIDTHQAGGPHENISIDAKATSSSSVKIFSRDNIELQADSGGSPDTCIVETNGDFSCPGSKNWIHSFDDGTEAVYSSQEGPEVRAVMEGTASTESGYANVSLPSHFSRTVSDSKPQMTVQVTPLSTNTYGLAVTEKTDSYIIVEELRDGSANIEFDYRVTGVREGYEDKRVVREER